MQKLQIPNQVKFVLSALQSANFEAFIVGGCVRDLLRGVDPKDWDITTNAKPDEIMRLFPDSFYDNAFGTVGVKSGSNKPELAIVQITTYRIEDKYSDKRHPDRIVFAGKLGDDLKRRDFTINALAMGSKLELTDLFGGQEDLKNKLIHAVGEPKDRFSEDALRMMRAVRLATELGFSIEEKTFQAIKDNAHWIDDIAKERIRDELIKTMDSKNAYWGVLMLHNCSLLEHVIPELEAGVSVTQNKHHVYTVFEHNTLALKWGAEHDYPFHVKLAALLHDVGKPMAKRGEGPEATFYGHELAGARITKKILARLKFRQKLQHIVTLLVKYHLFYYNVGEVTPRSVRRLVAKVGRENMADLIKVRICDRMGSGVPKAEPYRLRHFKYMVERVQKDPISRKMLKVKGDEVMKILGIQPGHKVGWIIAVLLDEVLDEPKLNKKTYLRRRVGELGKFPDSELIEMAKKAHKKEQKYEEAADEGIKEKYYV